MKLAYAVVAACALIMGAEAKPGPNHQEFHHHMTLSCMEKEIRIPALLNDTAKSCHQKVFGDTSPQKLPKDSKKFMCAIACHMEELGLVDDNGKIIPKEVETLINDIIPKEAIGNFTTKIRNCIETFGSEEISMEGDCSKGEKLFQCAKRTFIEVCMPSLLSMLDKE